MRKTLFTLTNLEHSLQFNTHWSAPLTNPEHSLQFNTHWSAPRVTKRGVQLELGVATFNVIQCFVAVGWADAAISKVQMCQTSKIHFKLATRHCRTLTPSTAMKFRPKFFWKWSFFDQIQQPLKGVEHFERIFRALFISQCPYKFSSFLDLRNASNTFRLFLRDFRLFRFFFLGSAWFSSLASLRNLPSWVKYHGKFESFGKEFRWPNYSVGESEG